MKTRTHLTIDASEQALVCSYFFCTVNLVCLL